MKKQFLACMCFPLIAFAQGRKYSNEFLNIGVDAHALGMSNARVAGVNDVTAGFWNPAGLTQIGNAHHFALMHANYFAGLAQYDYLSASMPVDALSTIAISLVRFGVDDIPDTGELIDANGNIDYSRIKLFSAADYALFLSYARKIPAIKGLSLGANAKLIYRNVGRFANAYGFGFDIGAQYKYQNWQFGAMLRDASSTFNLWLINQDEIDNILDATGNSPVQNSLELTIPRLIIGAAHTLPIKNDFELKSELNADFTFDGQRNTLVSANFGNIDPMLGLEFGYKKLAFIRAGLGNLSRETDFDGSRLWRFQPNLGLGFQFKGFALDYAFTDLGDQSTALYSHIFSLKYRLQRKSTLN